VTDYTVYVTPRAWTEIKDLPGNVRQRVRRAIDEFGDNPHPPRSKKLETPELEPDLYRLRIDRWRIVYAIDEEKRTIDVLTVRKRPPYDYGDLAQLIQGSN
jgi:mRNA interferase RelE/StbE